ncbi:MAG: VCBS repeat-containing protein [Ardenticatenia bacterium]|nr:VCBS repeat-containing protein [Ardenticatenia bacterium]
MLRSNARRLVAPLAATALLAALGLSRPPAGAPAQAATARFADVSLSSGVKPEALPAGSIGHPRTQVADINGDGWDDLLAHNMFPNVRAGKERFEHLVFLNTGKGTFRDYSAASGLKGVQAAFFAFADWDNDGDLDVFGGLDIPDHPDGGLTNQILLNDGRGRFTLLEDSGVEVAVGTDQNGKPFFAVANAAVADFNGDAWPDLYLGQGQTSYGAPDQLFLGAGEGRFTDASEQLDGNDERPSNGSMACDVDNDGDQDILVAVYGVSDRGAQDFLWINDGHGGFIDRAVARGVASLPGGNYWRKDLDNGRMPEPDKGLGEYVGGNGFGVDCGDVDADGDIDLLVANISHPTEFPASDTRIPPEQREPLNYTRRWSDPSTLFINGGEDGGLGFRECLAGPGLALQRRGYRQRAGGCGSGRPAGCGDEPRQEVRRLLQHLGPEGLVRADAARRGRQVQECRQGLGHQLQRGPDERGADARLGQYQLDGLRPRRRPGPLGGRWPGHDERAPVQEPDGGAAGSGGALAGAADGGRRQEGEPGWLRHAGHGAAGG